MMKKLLLTLSMFGLLFVLTPQTDAASSLSAVCNGGASSKSAVCQDQSKTDPLTGSDGLLLKIANIIAIIAGIAAVIIIVLAGLRFVTSGGSSEDIVGARRTIIYALVGLVVIILARSLVGLVLSKL